MEKLLRKIKIGDSTSTSKSKGQGLVEFALSLPILLLVFFGIFEFGRLMFIYIVVSSSTREAARYGVAVGDSNVVESGTKRYYDCTGINNAATAFGQVINLTTSDVTITYDSGPSTSTTFASCDALRDSTTDVSLGDRIVITITYTYTPIAQYAGFTMVPSFTITSTSRRTIMKSIPLTGYGSSVSGNTSTPTPTPSTPLEPNLDSFADDDSDATNCVNVSIVIGANSGWSGNPGSDPLYYDIKIGTGSWGDSSAYTDPLTWNTGTTINNGNTQTYTFKAHFAGGGGHSDERVVTLTCTNGVLSQ